MTVAATSTDTNINQVKTPRVLYLSISYPSDIFGRQVERLMQAACDAIALAVIEAIQQDYKKTAGRDYFIVGMDWTQEGLRSIQRGELAGSFGGHVFEGAWAMVLIHDHSQGVELSGDDALFSTRQSLINSDNVDSIYRLLYGDLFSTIDFTQFSRAENSALKEYDLSVVKLM